MGRVEKGVKCGVAGCLQTAVRSLSTAKVKLSGLTVDTGERRTYLCSEHYKGYKKKTKKEKQLQKWRYMG